MKPKVILIFSIIFISLFSCKVEEVILHGDITGLVTDVMTNEPIREALVTIDQTGDSTITGYDGTYLISSLTPGDYDIKASKLTYGTGTKNVTVTPAETKKIDFQLDGIPTPKLSVTNLDFGLESAQMSFTISNIGKGKLIYVFTPSKDWINVHPSFGEVTDNMDTITVTIDRSGLSVNIIKETIRLTSVISQGTVPDIFIGVYLNGVLDQDLKYYKIVKIGTQIWMAENLNTGTLIQHTIEGANNGIIEKYCYEDKESICNIYGALYQWNEMMQYKPSDTATVGTTQGVCPDGWHIPTQKEWLILSSFLGGQLIWEGNESGTHSIVGGKLKESGTSHWFAPNYGATNETGFSALPGGMLREASFAFPDPFFLLLGTYGFWWTSTLAPSLSPYSWGLGSDYDTAGYSGLSGPPDEPDPTIFSGRSVRCVKD